MRLTNKNGTVAIRLILVMNDGSSSNTPRKMIEPEKYRLVRKFKTLPLAIAPGSIEQMLYRCTFVDELTQRINADLEV